VSKHAIIDGSILNEIALQRYIRREVRLMLELFESYDIKLSKIIRDMYREKMGTNSLQYKSMIAAIMAKRSEMIDKAKVLINKTLEDVGGTEYEKEWELLAAALGLDSKMPKPPKTTGALNEPFASGAASASTLGVWLAALKAVDFARIRDALALAASNQESVDMAVARAVGTKDREFRDGVAAVSRNNIRALVATAIAHVSQWVREKLWGKLAGVAGMVWVAILDAATTAICRARDNKVVMFDNNQAPEGASLLSPQAARPPAHPNCRSRMVAIIKGQGMPTRETFDEFLRAQTPANQNNVLGDAKAEMFRRGEVTLSGFVDDTGQELTLQQLRAA